jgi:hypothetical protein
MSETYVLLALAILALTIVLVALAMTLRLRAFERSVNASLRRVNDALQGSGRNHKEKDKRDDLVQVKNELQRSIDAVRSAISNIPAEVVRQIPRGRSESPPAYSAPAPTRNVVRDERYEELPSAEDGAAQLLALANRIVQQNSTTLEAFRASAGALAARVFAWPRTADGTPTAFIVEHHGTCYAVPNVVKPARLPTEWFNRPDFGVNDEIRRVLELPRLTRRGDDYDVQRAGVFGR